MRLSVLADAVKRYDPRAVRVFDPHGIDTDVDKVVYDTRKLTPGEAAVFACVPGAHVDGIAFAPRAYEMGARALICEREVDLPLPQIIVNDVRSYMGSAASVLCGRPSDSLVMIGLTGTNGKTTTAYMVRSLLRLCGLKTGMLGTIVYDDAAVEIPADRTTPEGPDIQRCLAEMLKNGATHCVMEVSSHGLHQGRSSGCEFDRVGFSNLTPEHLEYHRSMDDYFGAKRLLFTKYSKPEGIGSVNADDGYGRRLLSEFRDRCIGFAVEQRDATLCRGNISKMDVDGMQVEFASPSGGPFIVKAPFIGLHNLYNMLEALVVVSSLGYAEADLVQMLAKCDQVPGRLERVKMTNGVAAFVDYAHTPDGLEKVLSALRPLTKGRLTIVWGAGGDRSAEKRPLAGEVMARLADDTIITLDNPRSEDPAVIAAAVEAGVKRHARAEYSIILDRKEAISRALDRAKPGDTVIIAGKGPEREIIYSDRRVPFSDVDTVKEWAAQNGCMC